MAASHCYDDFSTQASNKKESQRYNVIRLETFSHQSVHQNDFFFRDGTPSKSTIEIKRIYKHPLYKYPNLYNDVAVIELGRRIEYDYDKFGDSPTCLDQGQRDNINKIATVQGYGVTEDGEVGTLLETNVTVITNELCKEYIDYNSTLNKAIKKQINKALDNGLNYGFLCVQGFPSKDGKTISGSCKGDSGGPLTAGSRFADDPQTLIGIVSGGIGCGKGVPGWYTKVAFFYPWIDCIIQTSKDNKGNRNKVEEKCNKLAQELVPPCVSTDDLLFADDVDLRSNDIFQIPSC